ncbi:MAG: D-alanyl-D-alanine carboxypeptidase [Defluviitaleaceae bacterium]|nr:D-alanyl-D-alanine carboxypeptidase [Defluviitaleaceae bacterium]
MKKIKKFSTIFFVAVLALSHTAFAYEFYHQPAPPPTLPLEAELALVVDAATGHILYNRGDPHARALPASMTKVMTALLLLESGADMDDIIFHSPEAVYTIPRNSSHIAMNAGESLTVSQALYAIMLPSANDVSNAIAEFVSGDMESFAVMMTQRAHELGAVNTNFTNAHGLPDDNHFTTLYDMHLIMAEAIKQPKFVQVINAPRYRIPPTDFQPEPRFIDNTNAMVRPNDPHFSLDTVGGKTGWTTPSGHTLVSYARRDGIGLITVVMAAERRDIIFNDTATLLNHGFEQFDPHQLFTASELSVGADLVQRSREGVIVIDYMPIVAERDALVYLPHNVSPDDVQVELALPNRLTAPVYAGQTVGRVTLTYNGRILDQIPLRTAQAGIGLPAEALESLAPAVNPLQDLATTLTEYYQENLVPEWLTLQNLVVGAATAVLGTTFLVLCVKFLRFGKSRRKRGMMAYSSKSFKTHISKNYKYR